MFEFGKQVRAQLIKMNTFSHVKSGSSLVAMYSKCDRAEDARRIFDHMPEVYVVYCGYGKNGMADAAIEFFNLIEACNVKLKLATFLSVRR